VDVRRRYALKRIVVLLVEISIVGLVVAATLPASEHPDVETALIGADSSVACRACGQLN